MLKPSIDFSGVSEKVKSDYLDVYDGVYAEVISTNRFDEDTDLSTMYLCQIDMSRKTEVKAKESFAITAAGHTRGELLDGIECETLIDTGCKQIITCQNPNTCNVEAYMQMPKFTSTTRRIQVGNGQYVGVLFVI